MTTYEILKDKENKDIETVIAINKETGKQYVTNSTVYNTVALFDVEDNTGARDKIISIDEFNTNYTI